MGAFSYVDIFLTKGIEYVLVIDFLLIFILFWRALTTPVEKLEKLPQRANKRKRQVASRGRFKKE
jgi:hypothetical protein